jgi:hypothetical protein
MLTAYLDESGHESRGNVFIAGHIGNESQWKHFIAKWVTARGKRKYLHLSRLRWSNPRTKELLARLGPLPAECGLTRVLGGVKVSDYEDLIRGDLQARALKGYYFALTLLVTKVAVWLENHERVEFVFEDQRRYRDVANLVMGHIATDFTNKDGIPTIAKWSFVPKGSTLLLEQADYLANALAQLYRDQRSVKCLWTRPILGDMTGIGGILNRKEIREIMLLGAREKR